MKSARDRVIAFSLRSDRPVVDTTVTDLMRLLNANSYQKGAWVLHMLRREMGDELFWKGMRSYYEDFRNKNALTDDFRKEMEKASNKNLENFFKQWLYTAGQPDLKITTVPGKSSGSTELIIEQTQDHLFSFEIEVMIHDENGKQTIKFPVTARITRIQLKSMRIEEIVPDPNVNLLFRIIQKESRPTETSIVPKKG
jgi:aminopeptidase N